MVSPHTTLILVVKAFAYGIISNETSGILKLLKPDYLAVSNVEEALELVKHGIKCSIIVLNPDKNSIENLVDNNFEPEIYNFELLNKLKEILKKKNIKNYPIHIKIDTGMKRLGFEPKNTDNLIIELKSNRNIFVKSVFTHLVGTDEKIHDDFTRKQVADFSIVFKKIQESFNYKIKKHVLNSSGIERFPEYHYDMVRLGIGLYGFSPNNQPKLENVIEFKTQIISIREVKQNETIGYGRAGKLNRKSKIAVLPVGYADGLNRNLSNGKAVFMLNQKPVITVGNICMDLCMIDITGIDAKIGDDVTIFGNKIPASEQAKLSGTISYEIITGISQRVKRIYI